MYKAFTLSIMGHTWDNLACLFLCHQEEWWACCVSPYACFTPDVCNIGWWALHTSSIIFDDLIWLALVSTTDRVVVLSPGKWPANHAVSSLFCNNHSGTSAFLDNWVYNTIFASLISLESISTSLTHSINVYNLVNVSTFISYAARVIFACSSVIRALFTLLGCLIQYLFRAIACNLFALTWIFLIVLFTFSTIFTETLPSQSLWLCTNIRTTFTIWLSSCTKRAD